MLSHYRVPGVEHGRQGKSRKITPGALLLLQVALMLIRSLGLPLREALATAELLVNAEGREVRLPEAGALAFRLDLKALRQELDGRLAEALEIAPEPRRGRPPATTRARRQAETRA